MNPIDDLYPQTDLQKVSTGEPPKALDLPDDAAAFYLRIINRLSHQNKELREKLNECRKNKTC
jgi:hypothetical protein